MADQDHAENLRRSHAESNALARAMYSEVTRLQSGLGGISRNLDHALAAKRAKLDEIYPSLDRAPPAPGDEEGETLYQVWLARLDRKLEDLKKIDAYILDILSAFGWILKWWNSEGKIEDFLIIHKEEVARQRELGYRYPDLFPPIIVDGPNGPKLDPDAPPPEDIPKPFNPFEPLPEDPGEIPPVGGKTMPPVYNPPVEGPIPIYPKGPPPVVEVPRAPETPREPPPPPEPPEPPRRRKNNDGSLRLLLRLLLGKLGRTGGDATPEGD